MGRGPTHVPGLKPWVMIGRDRSALWAVLESGLKSTRRLGRLFCGCTHGLTHVPGLKPWVMIGRDRSALWAVLESGLKSTAMGHPCPIAVGRQRRGGL